MKTFFHYTLLFVEKQKVSFDTSGMYVHYLTVHCRCTVAENCNCSIFVNLINCLATSSCCTICCTKSMQYYAVGH